MPQRGRRQRTNAQGLPEWLPETGLPRESFFQGAAALAPGIACGRAGKRGRFLTTGSTTLGEITNGSTSKHGLTHLFIFICGSDGI